jgi:tetratricopeptide (TPR) repeat protein
MKPSVMRARMAVLAASFLCSFLVGAISRAQVQTTGGSAGAMQQLNSRANVQQIVQVQGKEDSAYAAFSAVKDEDPNKKIKLGQDFLAKYPNSHYAENVDVGLMNAYYTKQDWRNFYASADGALALKPDEVDVLVTVGWVIPHLYDPRDPNAEKLLDKAESYEKRAIPMIATMPKPAAMKDAEFPRFKVQKSNEAHSALGLIYFRRQDYEDSVRELQEATQNTPSPDQTDLFILGTSLENLNRNAEAVQSFARCGQIEGGLQEQCKQGAIRAKEQSTQSR